MEKNFSNVTVGNIGKFAITIRETGIIQIDEDEF